MGEKTLSKSDKLAYFLNDTNEEGNGMYIASAYQNFINWQNQFLQSIIDIGKDKKYLDFYIEELEKKMPIYEASSNQALSLNSCFLNSDYSDFDELINIYTKRNIYNKDGTIDYLKYNTFIYDISSIEEELAKLILTGKCLFESDNLKLVKYWGEGFNGKSDILDKFYKKYKQIDLNDKEKEQIISFIRENKRDDYKPLFGGLQLLIFYLTNNNAKVDDTILNIISNAPEYLRIDEMGRKFFNDKGKDLKIEQIMHVFFFFEHLCFTELRKNLNHQYKEQIPEDIKKIIDEKLLNNNKKDENDKNENNDQNVQKDNNEKNDNDNDNDKIKIKELGAAVRRFISRYLVGSRADTGPNSLLLPNLNKIELWEEKFGKNDNLEEELSNKLEDLKITVGQSNEFYEKIKEEDEKEVLSYLEDDEEKQHNNRKQKRRKV